MSFAHLLIQLNLILFCHLFWFFVLMEATVGVWFAYIFTYVLKLNIYIVMFPVYWQFMQVILLYMWIARDNATFLASLKWKGISSQKVENGISTWNSISFLFYDAALHFNPINIIYTSIPVEFAKYKKFCNLAFILFLLSIIGVQICFKLFAYCDLKAQFHHTMNTF